MTNENPLVSIIVITYNSSKFVLETLESAKAQTYKNIELIVSDDCSTDNTVEVCRNWLEVNKTRFVRTDFITVKKNTGTALNDNRGLYASNGKWIKYTAGDDLLTENCIEHLINFIVKNRNVNFLVHGIQPFQDDLKFMPIFPPKKIMACPPKKQLIFLLKKGNYISGSTFFLERKTLIELNGFDERFKLLEDAPLIVKYNLNNHKIYLVEEVLLKYRLHSSNISMTNSKLYNESIRQFIELQLNPLRLKNRLYLIYWHNLLSLNKAKITNRFVIFLLTLISPISWLIRLYKLFGKSYFYKLKIIPINEQKEQF